MDNARETRDSKMGYVLLLVAIVCEIVATTCLKLTEGFTVLGWSVLTVIFYGACYLCFSKALLTINLSAAYATWCAAGIVLTTLISAIGFQEHLSAAGMVGIVLCVAGVVLVNLSTAGN